MAKRRADDRDGEAGEPVGAARARLTERAMLELSGEIGYAEVTVAALLERTGTNRAWFYATYAGKPDCYARAYESVAEELCGAMLGACAEAAEPAAGLRAAMAVLADLLAGDPTLAAGALAEVYVAGGRALAKRNEVFERLSRAIEHARRETRRSRHSPPPYTATFILDAIEAAVIRELREAGDLDGLAEELTTLALTYYPG